MPEQAALGLFHQLAVCYVTKSIVDLAAMDPAGSA
jgi:hypothetical protein